MANSLAEKPTFIYCTSNKLGISWEVQVWPHVLNMRLTQMICCIVGCPNVAGSLLTATCLFHTWSQYTCQVINGLKWAYCMTLQYPQEFLQKNIEYIPHPFYLQEKDPTRPTRPKQPKGKVNCEGPTQNKSIGWELLTYLRLEIPSKDIPYCWQYAINLTAHIAQQRNFLLVLPYFQANRYILALKCFCKCGIEVCLSQTNLAYAQWGGESGLSAPVVHNKWKSCLSMTV